MSAEEKLLEAAGVSAGYGKKLVVRGVNVQIARGEIVALIGHNGAGKSTLLKAIFGLVPLWEGSVTIDSVPQVRPEPRALLGLGVAYVPQGGQVFRDLTVKENLDMGLSALTAAAKGREVTDRVLSWFSPLGPLLRRRAGQLSGGEKQMLALAMGLVSSPRVLLLDEPSLGLAPGAWQRFLELLPRACREADFSCLVVEQKVREILQAATRVCVLRNGLVTFSGPSSALASDTKLREVYL